MKRKNSRLKNRHNQGITLIALIITIIILLILAGVTISTITGQNKLMSNAKQAEIRSSYTSAKEIIALKLMEIQTQCYSDEKDFNLKEIAIGMKEDNNITIEKYYNSETASIKHGLTENLINLTGIVISVNKYMEYKFLLGEDGNIIGVTTENIADTTEKTEFENIEDFEKEKFGAQIKTENSKEEPKNETANIPEIDDSIDTSKPIEITTYISAKSNTNVTLNFTNINDAVFEIEETTENMNLQNNVLKVSYKASSKDSCKIKVSGIYNGQNYVNYLIVYVEPTKTTIIDENGNTVEAYAIYNENDFTRMGELINHKVISNDCNMKLMNNLELNSNLYSFDENGKIIFEETAKEYNKFGTTDNPYSGIFEGNKKYISGLIIKNKTSEKTSGLFGMLSQDGIVRNLTIRNSHFEGGRCTSGIVGDNEGKVYRCNVERVTILGGSWAGGIAGTNNGDIIECSSILGFYYGDAIAGIAGANGSNDSRDGYIHNTTTGRIYRCYSTGYIGYAETGSIASHNGVYGGEGYIYDCYSTAKLEDNMYSGSIVSVQSYQGRGGYLYNSYYMNTNCNVSSVVTPRYYGNVTNSYSNDTTITAEKLNGESGNVWINDTTGINNGYPILRWQLEE